MEGLYYFLMPLLQTFVCILFWFDTIQVLKKQNHGLNFEEKSMMEQSLLLKLSFPGLADNTTSRLRQEYQAYQRLFQAQTGLVQQYLGLQAASLAEAVVQGAAQTHF